MFIPSLQGFSMLPKGIFPLKCGPSLRICGFVAGGGALTDIWRFVRAVRAVLLPVAAPAFGDAGHLVFAHKLLGAARFGVIVCFGSWKRRGKQVSSSVFESQKHREGCESERERPSSTGCRVSSFK